ncbi:uncharacterized protein LOC111633261 [Centruroides sculpturatus]|uniref:uncharacterized protein LOC111633261 n=1 Tax=Centruroides sculpturatus TaxID=218467 RepID=UPI000C6E8C35|nr:uncharacterized protein LOC111633261 [Centruroides sculpturatus]
MTPKYYKGQKARRSNIMAHFSLHLEATIFTAEGYAILQAIHHVTHKKEDAIICSDSKSVIKALHAQHEKSTLIQTINTILNQRHILSLQTKLIWTPAHKGIPINEQADKLAKTNPPNSNITHYITAEDLNSLIKSDNEKYMNNKWNT